MPHGLGKKGDLLQYAKDQNYSSDPLPAKKRARRSHSATEIKNELGDSGANTTYPDLKGQISQEQTSFIQTQALKKESHTIDTSDDVLNKVADLMDVVGKAPKATRAKKHPYGLTPGISPFSNHIKPTAEDSEEVYQLLTKLHGEHKAPEVIPPPSLQVAGCGEVPDLLDAIMRTLLSASTSANNANLALAGLTQAFGLRKSGVGKGSINWEAVHLADLEDVIKAITPGGLAKAKGTNMKKILGIVYALNSARKDAVMKKEEFGTSSGMLESTNKIEDEKAADVSMLEANLLSMDYLFEMSTDDAMEEMIKLPGIGVKTASCVILFCMKRPSFAVDTHVWRHCKWLGWVPPNATRDQTFSHCEVRIPDHLKYPLHQLFLKHGKNCARCQAKGREGTENWDNEVCPIEHLVKRTKAKRQLGAIASKGTAVTKKGASKGRKGKKKDDSETEESDFEMED